MQSPRRRNGAPFSLRSVTKIPLANSECHGLTNRQKPAFHTRTSSWTQSRVRQMQQQFLNHVMKTTDREGDKETENRALLCCYPAVGMTKEITPAATFGKSKPDEKPWAQLHLPFPGSLITLPQHDAFNVSEGKWATAPRQPWAHCCGLWYWIYIVLWPKGKIKGKGICYKNSLSISNV